jgi:Glycosyltransferase 61
MLDAFGTQLVVQQIRPAMRPTSVSKRLMLVAFPFLVTAFVFVNSSLKSAPNPPPKQVPESGATAPGRIGAPAVDKNLLAYLKQLGVDASDSKAAVELEALLAGRQGKEPTESAQTAVPSSREAFRGLPASTVTCRLQPDGTDICEYTNACIDLPTDESGTNAPSFLLVEEAGKQELRNLAKRRGVEAFAYDTADFTDPLLFRPRIMPFALPRLPVAIITPEEASMASGPIVTWQEDGYILQNALGSHLWGFTASVASPLFAAAAFFNASQHLGLPPLRNLVVLSDNAGNKLHTETSWAHGTPWPKGGTDRWSRELLEAILTFIAKESSTAGVDKSEQPPTLLQTALFEPITDADYDANPDGPKQRKAGLLPPRTHRSDYAGAADPQGKPIAGLVYGIDGYRGKEELMKHGQGIVEGCMAAAAKSNTDDVAKLLEEAKEWLPKAAHDILLPRDGGLTPAEPRSLLVALCALKKLFVRAEGKAQQQGEQSLDTFYHDPRPPSTSLRTIYTARDANFHPTQVAVYEALKERLSGDNRSTIDPSSMTMMTTAIKAALDRAPHRMCFKKAVVVGQRDNLVAGFAEAAYWRRFGHLQLGIPATAVSDRWPPKKVLLLDRVRDPKPEKSNADKFSRFFVNRHEMEQVIFKYGFVSGVNFTLLTDEDIAVMSLKEQAKVFASHGVVIVPHGATMTNFLFALSAHTAVIEINPYNIWCPIYQHMLAFSGHVVFPIYSLEKSRYLDYSFTWPYTNEQAMEFHKRCDDKGPWLSAQVSYCPLTP